MRRGVHIRQRIWTGGVQIRCDTGIFETPRDVDDLQIHKFTNLQIAPLIDQISVLGGVVVPIVDVGLSRFQKPIWKLASAYHR